MAVIKASVILVYGLLMGCGIFEKVMEKPKVSLKKVDVTEVGLNDAVFIFNFDVENLNRFPIGVDKIDYDIKVNSRPIAQGVVDKSFEIAAKSTELIPLPIKVKFSDVFQSVSELLDQGKLPYQVQGSVKMGPVSIPFDQIGEVNLKDLKN